MPVLGHALLLAKKPHGIRRSWKNVAELRKKYVPPGVELLRMTIPVLNPGKLSCLVAFMLTLYFRKSGARDKVFKVFRPLLNR